MKMDYKILASLMVLVMITVVSAVNVVDMDVDKVIIYPQSVSLVTESGNEGVGTQFMAGINTNAYMSSIRVSGASEMSVSTQPVLYYWESPQIESPIKQFLNQLLGTQVKIGEKEGTLKWIGENWIGIAGEKFTVMPISSITTIESITPLEEPNETTEKPDKETNVTWLSSGGKTVDITYLANGLSWEPVYFLDAGETASRFEFWAKVTNNFEDLDASVRLIGGDINIQGGNYNARSYMSNTQAEMAYDYAGAPSAYFDDAPTVSTAGEYEVYDLGKKSLAKDESRLISIFAGNVNPERLYVWNTRAGDKVQRIYEVENPSKTWVRGAVKVYENGMLMGEDTIEWTPKGRKAKITIGNAPDIEVSKKTSSVDMGAGYSYKTKYTTTLKLKNYKTKEVEVRLMDYLPGYIDAGSFSSSKQFTEKPGNMLEMNVTLAAGATEEIVYSYTT